MVPSEPSPVPELMNIYELFSANSAVIIRLFSAALKLIAASSAVIREPILRMFTFSKSLRRRYFIATL